MATRQASSDRIAALEALVERLSTQVADRDERIAELEKLLGDSRRSRKRQAAPFSKGDPAQKPARPGRKSGDEHGRHGHKMVPGNVDRQLDAPLPGCCPDCGGTLEHVRDSDQYQVELPDLIPVVTRFKVAIGRCTGCNKRVQGRHSEQTSDALGAAGSQIGPAAKAWAHWLHYGLGLSFGKCSTLLARLGVQVTAGALCQPAQSHSNALVPVHAELVPHRNNTDVVVMDETGWRVEGQSAWLWVATCPTATAYDVADGRSYDEAQHLVDADFDGTLVTDGWAPYRKYTQADRQTCLAHLLRRCNEMVTDLPIWARHTPEHVADILHRALDARDLDGPERKQVCIDLVDRVADLAEQTHPHDENRKLIGHLDRELPDLFTFLKNPDVDATNWRAEQAIRPAVVNRKVWGGNRTWEGAQTQSRIMTVLRTAAQQGVDAIDYLAAHARAPNPNAAPPLFT